MQELGIWIILAANLGGFAWPFLPGGSRIQGLGLVLGALVLGGGLLAFAHGRRFKATAIECLVTSCLFGAILILPLLPLLFWIELAGPETRRFMNVFLAFLGSASLGVLLLRTDRATGRYVYGGRELPELEGTAREFADSFLVGLGHPALSIRVASLGSFNAQVQGVRHCIVVVDRRAAESLSRPHFASLLAHEVGHLRLGGTYSDLLLISAWIAVLTGMGLVTGSSWSWSFAVLPWCWYCSHSFLSHLMEILCDRFAAKHSGTESTVGMLRRVHEDVPAFASGTLLWSLAGSHPPLEVRLAALGCAPRGVLLPYALLWSLMLLICLAPPLGAFVACVMGFTTMSPALEVLIATPLLYFVFVVHAAVLRSRRTRRKYGNEKPEHSRSVTWIRWLFGVSAATCILSPLLVQVVGMAFFLVALGSLVAAVIVGYLTGAFPSPSEEISEAVVKTLVEARGAFDEGRVEESLSIIDDGLARHPTSRYLAMLRGTMLINSGQWGEAAFVLEKLRDGNEDRCTVDLDLATLDLLRRNLERAEELVQPVLAMAPGGGTLHIAGLVAYERGLLDLAEERFLRAWNAHPKDAMSLCGRALVAMERGDLAAARSLVDDALAVEKPEAMTLLASALELNQRGDGEVARLRLNEAIQRARQRGMPGWIPYYERLAARKGLSLERPEP